MAEVQKTHAYRDVGGRATQEQFAEGWVGESTIYKPLLYIHPVLLPEGEGITLIS